MEEGADGDWATIETMFIGLMARLPRSPRREDVDAVLEEMELLREEIINRLEIQVKAQKTDVNDRHDGCHIQNSKPESFHELEPSSEKEQGEMSSQKPKRNCQNH
jgi:replication initiation protein RepC